MTIGGALIVAAVLPQIIPLVVGLFTGFVNAARHEPSHLTQAISGLTWIVDLPIAAFFQAGASWFALRAVRGDSYAFGDVFGAGRHILAALGMMIVTGLAVFFGFLLLVVPAFIVATGFWMALMLIVDRNLGAIESLQESWRISRGHKLNIFLLMLLFFAISLLGLCACCIGVLAVTPLFSLMQAYVYLRITGQQPAPIARAA